MDLNELIRLITEYFDLEDIVLELCDPLGIKDEDIDGNTLRLKARNLVMYCQHRDRFEELVKQCRRQRPNVSWPILDEDNEIINPLARRLAYSIIQVGKRKLGRLDWNVTQWQSLTRIYSIALHYTLFRFNSRDYSGLGEAIAEIIETMIRDGNLGVDLIEFLIAESARPDLTFYTIEFERHAIQKKLDVEFVDIISIFRDDLRLTCFIEISKSGHALNGCIPLANLNPESRRRYDEPPSRASTSFSEDDCKLLQQCMEKSLSDAQLSNLTIDCVGSVHLEELSKKKKNERVTYLIHLARFDIGSGLHRLISRAIELYHGDFESCLPATWINRFSLDHAMERNY